MRSLATRHGAIRGRVTRLTLVVVTICTVLALSDSGAFANSYSVTIPSAYPRPYQTITVTGSGFPARKQIPTGIQILECADPGGTVANLPTTAAMCDGTTQNPGQINTDINGNFSTPYRVFELSSKATSNINCDPTHFCVLWAGEDYNGDFLGIHAFSTPFEVGRNGSYGGSSSSSVEIWLPIVIVVVLGGGLFVVRTRKRQSGSPAVSRS
jgi:hypothetical protein